MKDLIIGETDDYNRSIFTIVGSRFSDEQHYYKYVTMFKQLFDMYGYVSKVSGPTMSVTMKHFLTQIELYYPTDEELKNTFISKLMYSQIKEAHSGVKEMEMIDDDCTTTRA